MHDEISIEIQFVLTIYQSKLTKTVMVTIFRYIFENAQLSIAYENVEKKERKKINKQVNEERKKERKKENEKERSMKRRKRNSRDALGESELVWVNTETKRRSF